MNDDAGMHVGDNAIRWSGSQTCSPPDRQAGRKADKEAGIINSVLKIFNKYIIIRQKTSEKTSDRALGRATAWSWLRERTSGRATGLDEGTGNCTGLSDGMFA